VSRPVQTSMFPDVAPDRPVGPIPASVQTGTNADLIATIAPLYLTGSVLDVTYGEGKWWDRFTPDPFTFHDLHKVDGVDFRALPHEDRSFDAVCFDPPYVPQGGTSTKGCAEDFRDRYGLLEESTPWWVTKALVEDGLAECARVTRGWLLVKCSDFVSGGEFHLGHRWMMDAAAKAGLGDPWDVIVHFTGPGPGGHNIWEPVRARRHHSYLLVFTVGSRFGATRGAA
jgi:hypothetical protein